MLGHTFLVLIVAKKEAYRESSSTILQARKALKASKSKAIWLSKVILLVKKKASIQVEEIIRLDLWPACDNQRISR